MLSERIQNFAGQTRWFVRSSPSRPNLYPRISLTLLQGIQCPYVQTTVSCKMQRATWKPNIRATALAPSTDRTAETIPLDRLPARGTAVVVGAGPAGSMAAIILAKRGFDVEVFEMRPEPDPLHNNKDRSYVIGMSHRGMDAAKAAGIDMAKYTRFPYRGGITANAKGELLNTTFHEPMNAKVLLERVELVRHFIDSAKELDLSSRVEYHWHAECVGVDLDKQVAYFKGPDGEVIDRHYDLLIGADGVNSKIRAAFVKQIAGFTENWYGVKHRIDKFFHTVPMPANAKWEKKPVHDDLEDTSRVLRFYFLNSPPHLSACLFHIVNAEDGTYSGGISYAKAEGMEDQTGGNFQTVEDYISALDTLEVYPEEFRRAIAEQFVQRPWYNTGTTLMVSKLHAGSAVLIGDAAHAVSAALGQGCNSALEDCSVLASALDKSPSDLTKALEHYESVRFPETSALGTLDREGWAMSGIRGKLNLSYIMYRTYILVYSFLHRLLPQIFVPMDLLDMVTIERLSYQAVWRRITFPFIIICTVVGLASVAVLLKCLRDI